MNIQIVDQRPENDFDSKDTIEEKFPNHLKITKETKRVILTKIPGKLAANFISRQLSSSPVPSGIEFILVTDGVNEGDEENDTEDPEFKETLLFLRKRNIPFMESIAVMAILDGEIDVAMQALKIIQSCEE